MRTVRLTTSSFEGTKVRVSAPGLRPLCAVVTALSLLVPAPAATQDVSGTLPLVLPGADHFSDKDGQPPVFKAYKGDTQVGFAFLTSDLPPEEMGYSGPIQVLVGLDMKGSITGVSVLDYRESLRSSRGDFLRSSRFQGQFAGKGVADPFRVRVDVEGISGATISVSAMARGIRNSARRVATTYLASRFKVPESLHPATVRAEQLAPLTWLDIVDSGLAHRLTLLERDQSAIELSFVYLRDRAIGEQLMGVLYQQAVDKAGERANSDHMFMVGIEGPLGDLYRATATYLVQDDDTTRMNQDDLLTFPAPRAGKIDGQLNRLGVLLVDTALVDAERPFEFLLDLRPGMGAASTMFPGTKPPPPPRVVAAAPAAAAPTTDSAVAADSALADAAAPTPDPLEAALEEQLAPDPTQQPLDFTFEDEPEETVLGRTLATTSWLRVGAMAVVLALAAAAFAAKRRALRWVALGATVAYLGFLDGGFLSVSHITSGIKVGPSVYLSDIPLLMLVAFTVVTTLLWGRVFCGFLCPFGALQDFMERAVPKRFRRELPRVLHERAWLVKYAVLVVVLVPAILGSDVSIFQYFEPFGTVFFFSASVVLWVIAAGILVAAAIVPRFYCRYMCPLGAALAVASTVSPFRIKRVEQCTVCKVCEQRCPTGAIQRHEVSFRECVRCNICETALIEKAGVCKHDMADVKPRLVQLKVASR